MDISDAGYTIAGETLDQTTQQGIDEEMIEYNIPEEKKYGFMLYLLWRRGTYRGIWTVRKRIIEEYGIEKEIANYKRIKKNAYAKGNRLEHHEERLTWERNYRKLNADELRIYARNYAQLPKAKATRKKREKIESKLYKLFKEGKLTLKKEGETK